MSTVLAYVDTETTGLDPRIHQPYEVCVWREDRPEPGTIRLPHTLAHADPQALAVGGYYEREMHRWLELDRIGGTAVVQRLIGLLAGTTLVGANPGFDAAMLTRVIGTPVWHYRLVDVESMAMQEFGWDRPKGLTSIIVELRGAGFDVPDQDHTAEGDVRATRAVHEALAVVRAAR